MESDLLKDEKLCVPFKIKWMKIYGFFIEIVIFSFVGNFIYEFLVLNSMHVIIYLELALSLIVTKKQTSKYVVIDG